jgi:hypothetical protein
MRRLEEEANEEGGRRTAIGHQVEDFGLDRLGGNPWSWDFSSSSS